MSVLEFEINDRLLSKMGLEAVQFKIQQFLELQELRLLALEIEEQIKAVGQDQDVLFREAKHAAWQKFKSANLQNVLS